MDNFQIAFIATMGFFGYVMAGVMAHAICDHYHKGIYVDDENVAMAIFWPITLICFIIYWVIKAPILFFKLIGRMIARMIRGAHAKTTYREVK
jgi:hypothetical protein